MPLRFCRAKTGNISGLLHTSRQKDGERETEREKERKRETRKMRRPFPFLSIFALTLHASMTTDLMKFVK